MMHSPTRLSAAITACFLVALPTAAVQRFGISQANQLTAPFDATLRVYLDILDEADRPFDGLEPGSLTATLGAEVLDLKALRPMAESGDGIAYVFLVDISKSLSSEHFGQIRKALEAWILEIDEQDRAAILAFGDSSRVVVDFTNNPARLMAGLLSLGPTDKTTLLHQALADALDLSRRRDPGLPGRRVLIVLTDGLDEGSGLAADDILARLRDNPTPIYAIGHSQLRDPTERAKYLDLLGRFASVSGGAFYESGRTPFAESYDRIRDAIRRVWVADFDCPTCVADGASYRLQLNLTIGDRVLSDGTDLRLLPQAAAPTPTVVSNTEVDQPEIPVTEQAGRPIWGWVLGLLLLASLAGLALWRRRDEVAVDDDESAMEDPADAAVDFDFDPSPPGRPVSASARFRRPEPIRGLRLIVVRGEKPGRQYRAVLRDRLVVGKRSTSDCVLTGEPSIDSEQFELYQTEGIIYIKNLSEHNPTLIDGLQIGDHQMIKSQELIGTKSVILRLVLDG